MIRPSDQAWLDRALTYARVSRDPATKVGAVIVHPRGAMRSFGCNDLPDRISATPERLHDRTTKLELIVHAEMAALARAARDGISVDGCTLYLAATDDTGAVWGGPPCTRCTVHMIQAGIRRIVSRPVKPTPSKWHADLERARGLLCEAAIPLHEIPLP